MLVNMKILKKPKKILNKLNFNMKVLVVIPARGGSKGLPGKNIKMLNGKPLIHYTLEAARKIFNDKCIYVSTDSEQIKKVVEDTGYKVPFLRPKELATDTSNSQSVLLHSLAYYTKLNIKPDVVILLQPTSPFRSTKHIEEALKLYEKDIDMVVSVKETKSNPYYVLFEENDEGFLKKSKEANFTRRQDCPKVWEYNGAIYIINVNSIKEKSINKFTKIKKYIMDSKTSLDIDDEFDFELAKTYFKPK